MEKLSTELCMHDLVLLSGGCNDHAVLASRSTGEVLGSNREGVWIGGDYNETRINGKTYARYLSKESEGYIKSLM